MTANKTEVMLAKTIMLAGEEYKKEGKISPYETTIYL